MDIIAEVLPPHEHYDDLEEDEDLSDEQIEQLLKQAEARLRQQQHSSKHDSRYVPTISAASKLDTSTLPKPYVQTDGLVARVDTHKILDERQRKIADGVIRTVEDPLLVRKKTLEVSNTSLSFSAYAPLPMRKTFPSTFSLDAESWVPSWYSSATCESFIIIVTLTAFSTQYLVTKLRIETRGLTLFITSRPRRLQLVLPGTTCLLPISLLNSHATFSY